MLSLISSPVNFYSVTMTSRRLKDKGPAIDNSLVKKNLFLLGKLLTGSPHHVPSLSLIIPLF